MRRPRKPSISPEDSALFRREAGDVKPLAHKPAEVMKPRPAPVPRQTLRDIELVRAEMLYGDIDPAELETGEELFFLRPGMQRGVLRKLRRGQFSVHSELDLHGYTVAQARAALAEFLRECRLRGARCVRIVHGKGNHSPAGRPILKGKLNHWLSQREEVLAFCSARPMDGGSGALYVLLKSL